MENNLNRREEKKTCVWQFNNKVIFFFTAAAAALLNAKHTQHTTNNKIKMHRERERDSTIKKRN